MSGSVDVAGAGRLHPSTIRYPNDARLLPGTSSAGEAADTILLATLAASARGLSWTAILSVASAFRTDRGGTDGQGRGASAACRKNSTSSAACLTTCPSSSTGACRRCMLSMIPIQLRSMATSSAGVRRWLRSSSRLLKNVAFPSDA